MTSETSETIRVLDANEIDAVTGGTSDFMGFVGTFIKNYVAINGGNTGGGSDTGTCHTNHHGG